jgi:hypothetical protein
MVFKKRGQSVKQIKKDIQYKSPMEQRRCSSCKYFVTDIFTKSQSNKLKCSRYRITIQSGGICMSYTTNL